MVHVVYLHYTTHDAAHRPRVGRLAGIVVLCLALAGCNAQKKPPERE